MCLQKGKFQHVRQSDQSRNCGAACLAMLLRYYGKRGKLKDITKEISVTSPNGYLTCRNSLIIRFAERNSIACCVVSAKDPISFIPFCLEHNIEIVMSYHPTENSPEGHDSLVTGCDNEFVFVNDPSMDSQNGTNLPIPLNKLPILMKANDFGEIVRDNTFLLFSKLPTNLPLIKFSIEESTTKHSVYVFQEIVNQVTAFVDPYIDNWIPLRS